jgi:hypothetical protein
MMEFEEFVRRGQAADRAATLALYQSMTTRELRQLHAAFVADKQSARMHQHTEEGRTFAAVTERTVAFCDDRLAIIDEVLTERKDRP